ncbi:MAG: hypothetical protein M3Z32_01945 [Acidobacteriota bacterium]|nr:hypothetical protein [Acidobacteriota bacterium]
MKPILKSITGGATALTTSALLLTLLAAPKVSDAQSLTLFGSLSNFDVYNDTGQETHGFEIELDGLQPAQAYYFFTFTRYGAPTVTAFPGGVYVRYASSWNPSTQQFTAATQVPASFTPTFGHSCVNTNIAGCDHFGIVVNAAPTAVVYRWLVADPATPGNLMRFAGPPVSLPAPTLSVVPPAGNQPAPAVVFEIRVPPPPAPEIPKPEAQYGEAKWVKVYKNELQREVALEELVGGNPAVPEDPGVVETAWKLLQFNPHSDASGVLRNQGGINSGSRAVIRRYEFSKYSGAYDPASHKAICGGDGLCTAPLDGELGDYIGSQMAAANVGVPSITVSKVGSGTVAGASGKINCGGSCTTTVTAGASVTLTANAGGGLFSGWSGACNGTQLSCTVTVNDQLNVTATFTPVFTLSIGRSGSGTITGNPAGALSTQISCGNSCSAKFGQGTTVTLSATPAPGVNFVGWSGACAGTAPTCDVTISADTKVQANFK